MARGLPRLHCLTDQTLRWQRRLRVRFFVNFHFSALMNVRTHGVQAGEKIGSPGLDASEIIQNLPTAKYGSSGRFGPGLRCHGPPRSRFRTLGALRRSVALRASGCPHACCDESYRPRKAGAGEGNRTPMYIAVRSGVKWLRTHAGWHSGAVLGGHLPFGGWPLHISHTSAFRLRARITPKHVFPFRRAAYQAFDKFIPIGTGQFVAR